MSAAVWERNVSALARYHVQLAERIRTAELGPPIVTTPAKSGAITAAIGAGGPLLHSSYDPEREARARAAAVPQAGTIVVFGVGAGHTARALLDTHRSATIVLAEPSPAAWLSVIRAVPIHDLFAHERVWCADTPSVLRNVLLTVHQPALQDGIHSVELGPWCADPRLAPGFVALHAAAQAAIQESAVDMSTMRVMGRVWAAHAARNLTALHTSSAAYAWRALHSQIKGHEVIVAAAGPGLDRYFQARCEVPRAKIIATDTALPALLQRGVTPVAVVSIDAQHWSYLHIVGTTRIPAILVADCTVAPTLLRRFESWAPIGVGHPFVEAARAAGAPLHAVPSVGRNVTGAGFVLARALGASRIHVVGADLAYPNGITYARDTYQHRLAALRAHRTYPGTTFFTRQLFGASGLYRAERADVAIEYRTPVLDGYRAALEELHAASAPPATPHFEGVAAQWDAMAWLDRHQHELAELIERADDFAGLSSPQLLHAIGPSGRAHVPLAAWLRCKTDTDGDLPPELLLLRTWKYARTILERVFRRY